VDADEERRRLVADATEAGVDPDAAVEVAEEVAHGTPLADAYRAVDRRVATGHTVEETEAILLDGSGAGEGATDEGRGPAGGT
jgi:hypothetical protein